MPIILQFGLDHNTNNDCWDFFFSIFLKDYVINYIFFCGWCHRPSLQTMPLSAYQNKRSWDKQRHERYDTIHNRPLTHTNHFRAYLIWYNSHHSISILYHTLVTPNIYNWFIRFKLNSFYWSLSRRTCT